MQTWRRHLQHKILIGSFVFLAIVVSLDSSVASAVGPKKDTNAKGECLECENYQLETNKNQKDLQKISKKLDPIWGDVPAIAAYSSSPEIKKMISTAMKRKKRRTARWCYKFVKDAMLAARLVKTRPPGRYARDGVKDLLKQGFVNLLTHPLYSGRIKDPASAPKGAILIYQSRNGRGHTEIKTDFGTKGGYVSDYYNPSSVLSNELAGRSSRRYKLVGVMIKPMGGSL